MSGFKNRPRILKGAFVEYSRSVPPLFVPFQFNPEQLQRNRSLTFDAPNKNVWEPGEAGARTQGWWSEQSQDLREWHQQVDDLDYIREYQIVSVQEETLNFDLRLDATDALDAGNTIAERTGVAPALSTLELMIYPKGESVRAEPLRSRRGNAPTWWFAHPDNPPLVLFIWGVQRVLPVNINSLAITETEFDTLLNPVRASVAVNLTVIEGKNSLFKYSKGFKEAMSVLNVVNMVTDIVIPG
ncbi:MAG: hypothetical protein ACRDRR_00210 [Pseudonocardiaceae bacterium]